MRRCESCAHAHGSEVGRRAGSRAGTPPSAGPRQLPALGIVQRPSDAARSVGASALSRSIARFASATRRSNATAQPCASQRRRTRGSRSRQQHVRRGQDLADLLVRLDPRRRHAGIPQHPEPERALPGRRVVTRAASAPPGTAARRTRPPPSPRGSAARRCSPTSGRPRACPRRRVASPPWPNRNRRRDRQPDTADRYGWDRCS